MGVLIPCEYGMMSPLDFCDLHSLTPSSMRRTDCNIYFLGSLKPTIDMRDKPIIKLWFFSVVYAAESVNLCVISPVAHTAMTIRNRGLSRRGSGRKNSSQRSKVAMDWMVMDGYTKRIFAWTRNLIDGWEARRVAALLASGSNGGSINHYWLLKNMMSTLIEEVEVSWKASSNIVRNVKAGLKEVVDHSNTLDANMTWDIFSLGSNSEPVVQENNEDEAVMATPNTRSAKKKTKLRKNKGLTSANIDHDAALNGTRTPGSPSPTLPPPRNFEDFYAAYPIEEEKPKELPTK